MKKAKKISDTVKIDFTYRNEVLPLVNRLEGKKKKLDAARPLPDAALRNIREALSIEWTYNSNAIEGNSLTLRETQMVLEDGITISGKSLREHFEAKNHETALKHLYALAQEAMPLRSSEILTLHSYVLRSIEDDYAGRLRTGGVRIAGDNFIPPMPKKYQPYSMSSSATPTPIPITYRLSNWPRYFIISSYTSIPSLTETVVPCGWP